MRASHLAAPLLTLALLAGLSAPARGEVVRTPINWQVEIKFGPYKAAIDEEFSGSANPFSDIYGDSSVLMGIAEVDFQFWRGVGSLAVGGSIGYARDIGTSIIQGTNTKSNDETSFNVVPMQLSLIYHFDYLAERYSVPLVPFVKVGLDYWVWWFRDASDEVAQVGGSDGQGGTFGWHWSAGLKILLDWIDSDTATSFDNEFGVNNSYIFAEFLWADVDDFGASDSLRVGDHTFFFGLSFEL
jgi:hypothetical protein